MKTHPNTTAWLNLVVLDGDPDTTGCSGDRVAIGRIAERGGTRGDQPLFEVRPEREVKQLRVNSTRSVI
jgi:hypothetical protein